MNEKNFFNALNLSKQEIEVFEFECNNFLKSLTFNKKIFKGKLLDLIIPLIIFLDSRFPKISWWFKKSFAKTTSSNQSIRVDEALKLFLLVRAFKPKTIIETGTSIGFSTAVFAKALELNGFGRIISIDVNKNTGSIIPKNLMKRVKLIQGKKSLEFLSNWSKPIDLFFHDDDHSFENVLKEIKIVENLVPRKGLICFHDISLEGVKKAFNLLDNKKWFKILEEKEKKEFGLAIAVKK
jgi:predicted O-methyltransferase YrrM